MEFQERLKVYKDVSDSKMNQLVENLTPEFRPLLKEYKFKNGDYQTNRSLYRHKKCAEEVNLEKMEEK
jgi:hypothetical protein